MKFKGLKHCKKNKTTKKTTTIVQQPGQTLELFQLVSQIGFNIILIYTATEASPSPELIATAAIIPPSSARRSKICCHHFNEGQSRQVMDACYLHHNDLGLLVITLMHRKQGHIAHNYVINTVYPDRSTQSLHRTSLLIFGKTASYLQIKLEQNCLFFSYSENKTYADFNQ